MDVEVEVDVEVDVDMDMDVDEEVEVEVEVEVVDVDVDVEVEVKVEVEVEVEVVSDAMRARNRSLGSRSMLKRRSLWINYEETEMGTCQHTYGLVTKVRVTPPILASQLEAHITPSVSALPRLTHSLVIHQHCLREFRRPRQVHNHNTSDAQLGHASKIATGVHSPYTQNYC